MEPKDPRELLGMLAARPQHFAAAAGGVAYLTQMDIAHVLGKIKNPDAVLFARVKYCQQFAFADELAYSLRRRAAVDIDENRTWRMPRKDFLLDLCRLALVEDIDPHTCPWCNGVQFAIVDGKQIACGNCKGAGISVIKDKDRALLLNISKSSFCDPWKPRYELIQQIINKWEEMLPGSIRNRMRLAEPA